MTAPSAAAFPSIYGPGMTLRQWYAGQALVGILTNASTPWSVDVADIGDADLAKACVDLADAMIAAEQEQG